MSRPIPTRLLIHQATLNDVVRGDYGEEQDKMVAELRQVRFEPSARIVTTASGADVQCVATLFVDGVNSFPRGVSISIGQSVLWEGRRYRVQDVAREHDERKLHHLEVELSDG